MKVYCGTSSSPLVHYLAGRYPETLGWMVSPGDFRMPVPWLDYAIDNGAWGCFSKGLAFDRPEFEKHCERYYELGRKPAFVVAPDVVGDAKATRAAWEEYRLFLLDLRFPIAYVLQEGWGYSDIPDEASWVFIGGKTWVFKKETAALMQKQPLRVHVGRVMRFDHMHELAELGVASVDSTQFGRTGAKAHYGYAEQLCQFLAWQSGEIELPFQTELTALWAESKLEIA